MNGIRPCKSTRIHVLVACALWGCIATAAIAETASTDELSDLDLGRFKLTQLSPGQIVYDGRTKIINRIRHRHFTVTADSARFEFRNEAGDATVLGGKAYKVRIAGYISFKNSDEVSSLIIERADDFTLILHPTEYQLPPYYGGRVQLTQQIVWVGNSTPVDLLANKGTIYFRAAGVRLIGAHLQFAFPPGPVTVSLASDRPKDGVRFEFQFQTGQLEMVAGSFGSEAKEFTNVAAESFTTARSATHLYNFTFGRLQATVAKAQLGLEIDAIRTDLAAVTLPASEVPALLAGTIAVDKLTARAPFSVDSADVQTADLNRVRFSSWKDLETPTNLYRPPEVLADLERILQLPSPEEQQIAAIKGSHVALYEMPQPSLVLHLPRIQIEQATDVLLDSLGIDHAKTHLEFGKQELLVPLRYEPTTATPATTPRFAAVLHLAPSVEGVTIVLRPSLAVVGLTDFDLSGGDFWDVVKSLGKAANDKIDEIKRRAVAISIPFDPHITQPIDLSGMSKDGVVKITASPVQLQATASGVVLIEEDGIHILGALETR